MDKKARILDAKDTISNDIYDITEGPDRKGAYVLINEKLKKQVRAHPSRILPLNSEGSPTYRSQDNIVAKCPKCQNEINVEASRDDANCAEHGDFKLDWSKIDSGPWPLKPEEEKKVAIKTQKKLRETTKIDRKVKAACDIDFEDMKKHGELWTNESVEFDYPGFTVKAHVLIILDGKNDRKWCFNSYNDGWGKKPKTEDLQAFIGNKTVNGGKIGYNVKDIVQERKKLAKNGYSQQ